ncbi:hypothetical protein C8J56DRAFT_896451 [Mycena floridula]|nr:hypothetical protein C8J56DRAFT_896451 [Mycena floridula]
MRTPTQQAVFQPAGAADSSPFGGSSSTTPSSPSPPQRKKKTMTPAQAQKLADARASKPKSPSSNQQYIPGLRKGDRTYSLSTSFLKQTELERINSPQNVAYDHGETTKRFKRILHRLLRTADQLSNESSGWLYVIGHHPNLRHEYIHYCSPHLSNEGGQAFDDAHAAVNDLFTALQMSRRTEATELGAQLAQQQRENEQLRKCLAAAEAQLGP